MSDIELSKAVPFSSRQNDDAALPRRRILTRMFHRLGGDTMKAFVEARAPELVVESFGNDQELSARLGEGAAVDLIVWRQLPTDTDAIAGVKAAVGANYRGPILVIVDRYDAAMVSRAMAHGITGLVSGHMSADMVLCVLRLILAGGTYFPCEPAWIAPATAPSYEPAAAVAGLQRGYGLTPRQLDVLGYICQGMSNKIIARALGMRETTVKAHVMQIMRRLNADNRTQVALRVAHMGLPAPQPMSAAPAKD
jgi:DNA-binding NarL/FixJ family response regulator